MPTNEENIQAAIADLRAGIFTSQRKAARAYDVPESTLRERLQGRLPYAIAHQQQQRLSSEQEEFLVQWILKEDERGYPPSHARAREMATRILRMNGDLNPLGRRWISHFIERNPRVASVIGRKIHAERAGAATAEQIQAFYELFERVRKRLNIRAKDTWNIDETGVALGVCANTRVLASSRKKKAYVKSPEDREWVLVVETISAAGQKLQPLVIFRGKNL